jgi:phosphate transport system permease protein
MSSLRWRQAVNVVAFVASTLATLLGLAVLGAILWTLISRGLSAFSWQLFTQMTPAPQSEGGLLNAIFGSAVITVLGILMGAPVGMLAGTRFSMSSVVRTITGTQMMPSEMAPASAEKCPMRMTTSV